MDVRKRLAAGVIGLAVLFVVIVVVSYLTIPLRNTDATHFDTLVVLGMPADEQGQIKPEPRERVLEAVREFRAGRAGHMIMTGGAAHNRWVEAEVMARYAESQGVPAEDVVVEGQALNTIQNIYYSHKIMQASGWTSAEIVSSPAHLPRTSLILEHYRGANDFAWRTDESRWPVELSRFAVAIHFVYEATGTTKLRLLGFRPSRFLPGS
jgi:uncharacterized SAM-binding protein YcdF (DUF218 family)